MADFVINPRRAPRASMRCRADVSATNGARWTSETEDIGPRGCQIVAPGRLARGDSLLLNVTAEGLSRSLRAGGTIAWISPSEPWRLGISFAEQDAAVATAWFDALVAKHPALAAYRGIPDRISADATVFLGPPPRLVMDFTGDEIQILRCIGSGTSIGEIRIRLKDTWDRAQHALFSLLIRRHLVLARGASVLPATWKEILAHLEATLAVEELERTAARPTPAPAVRTQPPPPPRAATPPPRIAPPPPQETQTAPASPSHRETRSSMRAIDAGGAWGGGHAPKHDFTGAGVGWRAQGGPRSLEAEQLFTTARLDAEAGKVDGAIAMLRRALQLAPGDPEIAALLGQLAFRDRSSPQK